MCLSVCWMSTKFCVSAKNKIIFLIPIFQILVFESVIRSVMKTLVIICRKYFRWKKHTDSFLTVVLERTSLIAVISTCTLSEYKGRLKSGLSFGSAQARVSSLSVERVTYWWVVVAEHGSSVSFYVVARSRSLLVKSLFHYRPGFGYGQNCR